MFDHDICSSLHSREKPLLKVILEESHFSEKPYSWYILEDKVSFMFYVVMAVSELLKKSLPREMKM
jgi:ATP-dependent Clp protease adapter protein ClpS